VQEFDRIVRFWGDGGTVNEDFEYKILETVGTCNNFSARYCEKPGQDDPEICDPKGTIGNPACDARPTDGFVPRGGVIGIPFAIETVGHNVVPASSEMQLCFAEHGNTPSDCNNPLIITDVSLEEYRAQESYIFPSPAPQNITCEPDATVEPTLSTGACGEFEINTNHRFARIQRYAMDYGITCNGDNRGNLVTMPNVNDPLDDTLLRDWCIYDQPVVAQADSVVVVREFGHPVNTYPPENIFADFCSTRTCADPNPAGSKCEANPDPTLAVIPGSGNQTVILHDNSPERTIYTHMIPGSNDTFQCAAVIKQSDEVGRVGSSGNSSAPHIHISTLTTDSPETSGATIWPDYFTNIAFPSAATFPAGTNLPPHAHGVRRQLDIALPTRAGNGIAWDIVSTITPIAANADIEDREDEPNNTLDQHNTLVLPATITALLEDNNVGDLAVRGDASLKTDDHCETTKQLDRKADPDSDCGYPLGRSVSSRNITR